MLMLAFDCLTNTNFMSIIKLLKKLLEVIQILVPIGLIFMGSIDFGKAVIAAKEDDIKKGQKTFISRCIAAAMVFLVVVIVNAVMGFLDYNNWSECWKQANAVNVINIHV